MAEQDKSMTPPMSENLSKQYRLRFEEREDYRRSVWRVICTDFLSRCIPEDSTVLDLGTGWGEFINNTRASRKIAMDLNPDTRKHLLPEVAFIHQDCSERWGVESGSLDVVFTSNFLEHLYDKPSIERVVAEAFRCLKDGGLFICLGPNVKCIPGAYWDYWDHQVPITDRSCGELLRLAGFVIQRSIPRFLPYKMSTGIKAPLALVRLYLRLPFLWPLFGKQFLVIGRKVHQSGERTIS